MSNPSVWAKGVLAFLFLGALPAPVMAPALALATAGFSLLFVGEFFRVLFQGLVDVPSAIPGVKHPPPDASSGSEDPAYRQYFFGQAQADVQATIGEALGRIVDDTRQTGKRIERLAVFGRSVPARVIGSLVAVGFMVAVGGAAVVTAAVVASYVAMVVLLGAVTFVLIGVLRSLDSGLLRLRRIRMTCPTCYRHVPYPSYDCPSCGLRHRDPRPGRYGLFRRVCSCTHTMPTLLLLGSHHQDAFCPYCRNPLARHAGTAAEVVLPFFGAGNAGKTRLMLALVTALQQSARDDALSLEFADPDTEQRVGQLQPAIERGRHTAHTITALPRAYSLHIRPHRGAPRFIHLFDAAGERFNDSETLQELQYFTAARSFLFVLDPLSVDRFWDHGLAAHQREQLAPLRSLTRSPEFVFQQTLQNIEAMGVDTKHARLAVAVSKADLVRDVSTLRGVGNDSAQLAQWLDGVGLGNLLRSVNHSFGESRFFLTEAVLDDGDVDGSVVSLLRWILDGERVRLT